MLARDFKLTHSLTMPQSVERVQCSYDDDGLEAGTRQVLYRYLEHVLHKLGLIMFELATVAQTPKLKLVPC